MKKRPGLANFKETMLKCVTDAWFEVEIAELYPSFQMSGRVENELFCSTLNCHLPH